MAQVLNVRLARNDMSPWGFRLQGGKDFGTPLVIQKVNGGSPADRVGLQAGDAVIRVNGNDVFNLRHKDAQDAIVRAGQSFELTVQRGQSTWKPAVTTVGSLPTPKPTLNNIVPVTKTSLAANKQQSTPIGTGHNLAAKPFLNGTSDVRLVNKQFNSPIGLYSEASIAETLSAQSEVLSTGALGVNFKKNEKTYNAANSEVLKMVQEADKEPRDFEPEIAEGPAVGGGVAPSNPAPAPVGPSGLRHVTAPVSAPPSQAPPAGGTKQLPPGQNICADCERLIVGVFVRIKDKNLHVECFKCATCGTSLKNVGYYNINNKLYCDIHAKLAAKNNPPAPNLVPITIPPGGKIPAGTISAALAAHPLPSPLSPSANVAPAPFQIENEYRNDVTDNSMPVPSLSSNSLNAFASSLAKAAEKRQNGGHDNGTVAHAKPFKGKLNGSRSSTLSNDYLDKSDYQNGCQNGNQNGNSNGQQNGYSNGHKNGHSIQNNKMNGIQNHNGNNYRAINKNGYQYQNGIKQNGSFQNGHVTNNNGYQSIGYRNGQQNGFQNRNNNLKNAFLNGNNETKPKTYVSEKIITVNNGNSNNTEKTVELKSPAFFNFKPSTNSVLSGPRPFNAGAPLSPVAPVSAPITNNYAATLPRSAPQQSAQPELPSVDPESEIQVPESVPHEPEPPQVSTEDRNRVKMWPPPKTEVECPTATPLYVPPTPSNPVRIKPLLPKYDSAQNVELANPESQQSESENVTEVEEQVEVSIATRFGESIMTQSEQKAWKPVPGPTGTSHTNEASSVEDYGTAFDVLNRLPKDENDNLVYSAEVTDITGRKSVAECAETIAETVDTQMLIEKLTEEYRPPTPPPMPPISFPTNVPPIPEFKKPAPFTSNVASIETKEYRAVKGVCTKSKQSVVSEIQELTKQVVTDVQKQLELVVKQVDSVQKQLETVESSVIEKIAPKATDLPSECPTTAETCPKTNIEQFQIPPQDTDQLLECPLEASTCLRNVSEPLLQESIEAPPIEAMSESQNGSSNSFLNTVPKQWQSQLLSALTVASDRPYSPLPSTLETEATEMSYPSERAESSGLQYKQITESNSNGFVPISTVDASTDFPHSKSKTSTTQFTSALTIAPSQPFTPQPTITLDPVPLPEETVPYIPEELPKQEFKKSVQRQETGVKSPFLEALITAPPRPYATPGSEIPEGQLQQGNLLQDLPTPDYNATMLSALTTAPERPFTPVWNEQLKDPGPYPEQPNAKSAFKPVPPKSIAPSIQPPMIQAPKQPATSKTFPPVSDNLKSVYKPSVEIAPSKIVKPTVQQQDAQSYESIEQTLVGKPPTPKPQIAKPQTPRPYYSSAGLHKPSAIPHYQQSLNQLTQLPSQTAVVKTPEPDTVIEHESIESHEFQQQKINESQQRVAEKQKNQQSLVSKTVEASSVHQQSQISVQKSEQSIFSAQKPAITTVSVYQKSHVPENISQQSVLESQNPVPWRRQSLKSTKKSQIPVSQVDAQQPSGSLSQVQASTRPIITVQSSQQMPPSQALFKPVTEKQSSLTRPTALTPSMINNPAPIIPHYQVNLIAREHLAPETNMYDPSHPEISRSPSPHPNRSRSPFLRAKSPVPRSRSPSEGPNLRAQAPRIKDDKQNVTNIPKYQSQGLVQNRKDSLLAQSATTTKHVQFGGHFAEKNVFSSEKERVQCDYLEQTSQRQSLQNITTGSEQIQRKKIATEEIEHSRKVVEIERAIGSSSSVLKVQDGAIITPQQQKIKQVHSAKGLKIYETSSGKPVPVHSQSLFQTPPQPQFQSLSQSQMDTLPKCQADVSANGGLIKPRPISGVPNPFVPLTSNQTRPLSAFSMIPNKTSGFAPVNRQPAYTNQQTNAMASNASVTASPPPVVSNNVSSIPPAGVPSAPFGGGAPGAPFGGGVPRPGPAPGAIGGGVKGKQTGAVGIAPRRGKGILNKAIGPGARVPLCAHCNGHIRGPFITALGKIWCPEHFVCATPQCRRPLQDLGFVEEKGLLYCEHCFEQYLAPSCDQCKNKIKGDCLNAIGKHFHPECFSCAYCGKLFGNNPFFLEDALPYCEADWNELFTTKCFACGFPVEAGDRWVEALNNNYHSQCFNCTMCKKNLEGQSFYAKGGRPYCKNHAR